MTVNYILKYSYKNTADDIVAELLNCGIESSWKLDSSSILNKILTINVPEDSTIEDHIALGALIGTMETVSKS